MRKRSFVENTDYFPIFSNVGVSARQVDLLATPAVKVASPALVEEAFTFTVQFIPEAQSFNLLLFFAFHPT